MKNILCFECKRRDIYINSKSAIELYFLLDFRQSISKSIIKTEAYFENNRELRE